MNISQAFQNCISLISECCDKGKILSTWQAREILLKLKVRDLIKTEVDKATFHEELNTIKAEMQNLIRADKNIQKNIDVYCLLFQEIESAHYQKVRELYISDAIATLQLDEEKSKAMRVAVLNFVKDFVDDKQQRNAATKAIANILKMTN